MTSEHVQLAWAEFESNAPATVKQLWYQQDFADVTLATKDDHQVKAHKFFKPFIQKHFIDKSSQEFNSLPSRNKTERPSASTEIYLPGPNRCGTGKC